MSKISITDSKKDREAAELNEMLHGMDVDKLGPGKLVVIDPSQWRNLPLSLM